MCRADAIPARSEDRAAAHTAHPTVATSVPDRAAPVIAAVGMVPARDWAAVRTNPRLAARAVSLGMTWLWATVGFLSAWAVGWAVADGGAVGAHPADHDRPQDPVHHQAVPGLHIADVGGGHGPVVPIGNQVAAGGLEGVQVALGVPGPIGPGLGDWPALAVHHQAGGPVAVLAFLVGPDLGGSPGGAPAGGSPGAGPRGFGSHGDPPMPEVDLGVPGGPVGVPGLEVQV